MVESMEQASWAERRCAMRVPVRGTAVLHATTGPMHGTLENLSQTGALVNLASCPVDAELELELRLAEGGGWLRGRTVRTEQTRTSAWQLAVAFEQVDPGLQSMIDASITTAVSAARRRPVLVIDDRTERRTRLIDRLVDHGMTPLAPRTPLEAIDLLGRAQLHISVCLLAPGFGVATDELALMLSDSFPWITTEDISDDLETTVTRAMTAWSATSSGRLVARG